MDIADIKVITPPTKVITPSPTMKAHIYVGKRCKDGNMEAFYTTFGANRCIKQYREAGFKGTISIQQNVTTNRYVVFRWEYKCICTIRCLKTASEYVERQRQSNPNHLYKIVIEPLKSNA